MKSTLVEPPPDRDDHDEEDIDFIRANSVSELAKQTNIGDEKVLERVLLPGKRFGPYHILGFVAAGGMGEIYAAQRLKADGSRSRPVALKVITAEFAHDWRIIERFKREARISKAIQSKHVARVYEFGESPQGHAFLSMELLDGEELFDRLHRVKVFSAMEVAELALQILKGLHKIHESGFVHRDIKPENIFLAKSPRGGEEMVKILDFGIAKRSDQQSDPLLSVAGQIYGTPQYLAPEQAINPDVDHRADLYSLGVVMYECVTGSLPFDGESSYDLIVAHQKEEIPPLPSSVDPAFGHIIHQALAKEPERRYQSAVEMGRLIKRWIDETSWADEEEPELLLDDGDIEFKPPPVGRSRGEKSDRHSSPSEDKLFSASGSKQHSDRSGEAATAQRRPAVGKAPQRASVHQDRGDATNTSPQQVGSSSDTPDATTELRSPRVDEEHLSPTAVRNAQIITGVALGIIILAILWTLLL